jgi:hypothetical protein
MKHKYHEGPDKTKEKGANEHSDTFTSAPAKIASATLTKEHNKFTKALASVLSASPKQIQDSRAQAKAEKPSPHTRYTYAPAKGQS